jgi:hypothetical protein
MSSSVSVGTAFFSFAAVPSFSCACGPDQVVREVVGDKGDQRALHVTHNEAVSKFGVDGDQALSELMMNKGWGRRPNLVAKELGHVGVREAGLCGDLIVRLARGSLGLSQPLLERRQGLCCGAIFPVVTLWQGEPGKA